MDLIADRFVAVDARRVVDLADGAPVALITCAGGAEIDEMAWAVRCDRFSDIHHPSIARLVDYGTLGGAQRFEAWRCEGAWHGPRRDAERALRRAVAFLAASGLGSGPLSVADVRAHDGRAVVLPPPSCGYVATAGAVRDPVEHLDACGIASVARRAVSSVAEVLADSAFHRPRIVAICGPPGAGLRTAAAVLARAARLNGIVPMACPVDDPRILTLTEDRSVLLIDRAGDAGGWRSLLDRTMRTPRAHVLLRVVARPPAEVRSVTLDRVPVEALIAAIRPTAIASSLCRRVEEAAGRARGLPGRFAALLWSADPDMARRSARVGARVPPRVAEGPATYGSVRMSPGVPPGRAIRLSPLTGSEAMRRRMAQAIGALEGGRRAAGDRALRAATAALARRHDWERAAFGSVALARSVLRRGRPQAAQVILAEARDYAERAGSIQLAGEVAVACGLAHLDLARLDEAENVLEAAMSAARAADDPSARRACSLALARCLFWRGRYDRAARALAEISEIGTTSQPAPDVAARLALVTLARRDIPTAVSGVVGAQEAAQRAGNRSHEAASAYAAAWVHLAIGDYPAVDRDVRGCIGAARATHDPLTALKARLVGAEAARRAGRAGTAAVILGRIRRIATISLPPIVQARCALLGDLLSEVPADEAVRKRIASSGLEALALLVPPPVDPARAFHSALDEVVQILTVCQTADDEAAVLGRLCSRIRRRLEAAAVAFVSSDARAPGVLAADGVLRHGSGIVERVCAAGQAIGPHTWQDATEGGAPVRYGGETIGALVARWPVDARPETARAASLLTMAAIAAAPVCAATVGQRARPVSEHGQILLGSSRAMAESRQQVDRAAAAPFAVVVEGESGCGKELVARALHQRSARRDRPFCTLNCAALPEDLVEAELFGHARGAFTGAVAERAGVFEEAHTGTLFLDEVGELSLRAQAKVLRTIQEGELRRVGENVSRKVDVRLVSATNRDLRQEVAAGRFRLDLLYRLDVIRIVLAPLRERREDIAVLAEHFWREATSRVGSRATLGAATVAALARYDWPGNVRELQNVLAALAVNCPRRGVVPPTALPPVFGAATPDQTWRLAEARRTFEERFVRAALVRTGGHRARAAGELGLTRQGLVKVMDRLGISD